MVVVGGGGGGGDYYCCKYGCFYSNKYCFCDCNNIKITIPIALPISNRRDYYYYYYHHYYHFKFINDTLVLLK